MTSSVGMTDAADVVLVKPAAGDLVLPLEGQEAVGGGDDGAMMVLRHPEVPPDATTELAAARSRVYDRAKPDDLTYLRQCNYSRAS